MKKYFKHYSNKAAKDAALEDMKVAKVKYSFLFKEREILNQRIQILTINI